MNEHTHWWSRPGLEYIDGRLHLAGRELTKLASQAGTPAFFYDAARVRQKVGLLHQALTAQDLNFRVFYAMKANRFAPIMSWLASSGMCGIDACSPQELQFALACGFEERNISYTATSVSDGDLDILARYPDVIINLDSQSAIRRLATRCPGREIGLRINPALGLGYGGNELLQYSGARTTKFGIYREQFDDTLELIAQSGLRLNRIHFHVGIGYLSHQLELWEQIVEACMGFVDQAPGLKAVNLGGGLGLPHAQGDTPLDLHKWAAIIERHIGSRGLEVGVEPGDFIVKDSGVLVLRVNTVERKRDTLFVGVDGGFNLAVEPAFYGLPCEPLPCQVANDGWREDNLAQVTIAGNINEALDIWAHDKLLPVMQEGDYLALINAGGYASAMSSNHCMRGQFSERLLLPENS
jgi:diaminopimelate decarboxylase